MNKKRKKTSLFIFGLCIMGLVLFSWGCDSSDSSSGTHGLIASIITPGPGEVTVGKDAVVKFEGTTRGGTEPIGYYWSWDAGPRLVEGSDVTTTAISLSFPSSGHFFVTFTVTDSRNVTDNDRVEVTVR